MSQIVSALLRALSSACAGRRPARYSVFVWVEAVSGRSLTTYGAPGSAKLIDHKQALAWSLGTEWSEGWQPVRRWDQRRGAFVEVTANVQGSAE